MTAPPTVNTNTRPTVLAKTVRRDLARDVLRESGLEVDTSPEALEAHLLAAAGPKAGR